jgi:hypothetical protein
MRSAMMLIPPLLLFAAGLWAADENPYAKAKVGEWVYYRTERRFMSVRTTDEFLETVVKKTDDEVTLDCYHFAAKGEQKKTTRVINLHEKFDFFGKHNAAQNAGAIKEVGRGEEVVKIGDYEFKTTWIEEERTVKNERGEHTSKSKVWYCIDAPFRGLVRLHIETPSISEDMQLVSFSKREL